MPSNILTTDTSFPNLNGNQSTDEKFRLITNYLTWQESQQAQPAKRWETIIAAVITGVVGFLLARFGM